MSEREQEILASILEFAYPVVEADFPGLPKEEWVKELVAIYISDRDFWMAAHPGGTLDQFLSDCAALTDSPMHQAAQAVMKRHR